MQRLLLCTAGALLASILGACGDDGGTTIDNYPDKLINVVCDHEAECGGAPDVASCKKNIDVDAEAVQADVKAGIVKFDSAAASDCLAFQASATCESLDGFHDHENPCEDVVKGTVADGGACNYDVECLSSSCTQTDTACDSSMMCCPGTCDPTMPATTNVAIGGSCGDSNDCVNDSYCKFPDGNAEMGTCTALITGGDGTSCDEVDACAGNSYCDVFDQMNPPTCVTPAATGATCDPDDIVPCSDRRDFCNAQMKCERGAAVGATCDEANGPLCVEYASCVSGTCKANPQIGEACGTADTDPECLGDTSCTSGTCQFGDPTPVCTL